MQTTLARLVSAPEWVNDEVFAFKIHGRDVLKAKDGNPNGMRTGHFGTFVACDDISWPNTLAWGSGGTLYLVSNHLHLWVDGDMDFDMPKVPDFRIDRMKVGAKPYSAT